MLSRGSTHDPPLQKCAHVTEFPRAVPNFSCCGLLLALLLLGSVQSVIFSCLLLVCGGRLWHGCLHAHLACLLLLRLAFCCSRWWWAPSQHGGLPALLVFAAIKPRLSWVLCCSAVHLSATLVIRCGAADSSCAVLHANGCVTPDQ